jgi:hypothetical protein
MLSQEIMENDIKTVYTKLFQVVNCLHEEMVLQAQDDGVEIVKIYIAVGDSKLLPLSQSEVINYLNYLLREQTILSMDIGDYRGKQNYIIEVNFSNFSYYFNERLAEFKGSEGAAVRLLRVVKNDRAIIVLKGSALGGRFMPIFNNKSETLIFKLLEGLVEHVGKTTIISPFEMLAYDLDTFMPEVIDHRNWDSKEKARYVQLYVPDEISKHGSLFFKKMYRHFIFKEKTGLVRFRIALSIKQYKEIINELGDFNYSSLMSQSWKDAFNDLS